MQQEKACKFQYECYFRPSLCYTWNRQNQTKRKRKRKPKAKKQSYFDIHFGQASKSQLALLTVIEIRRFLVSMKLEDFLLVRRNDIINVYWSRSKILESEREIDSIDFHLINGWRKPIINIFFDLKVFSMDQLFTYSCVC